MHEQVGASSVAQATASLVTYPHEVLRSHMHVEGSSSLRSMLHTFHQVDQGATAANAYDMHLSNAHDRVVSTKCLHEAESAGALE